MPKKIPCDWFLTDGILPPVRLGAPARAMDALIAAGVVQRDARLMESLKTEWVLRRAWRYSARFSMPAGEEPRCFLALSGLHGNWRAHLNGADAAAGEDGDARFEATGRLTPENNVLEIEFSPEKCETLAPTAGFDGGLYADFAGEAAILAFAMRKTAEGEWRAEARVDATRAGEYDFRYTAEMNGGKMERCFRETLRAGVNDISHAPFAPPNAGRAEITLAALSGARASDEARWSESFPGAEAPMRGLTAENAYDMALIARLGGNAARAPENARARMMAAENGLAFAARGEYPAQRAGVASQPLETLLDMAGGDETALQEGALWRLSGVSEADLAPAREALSGSARDIARASRYLQAVEMRNLAQRARLRRESFCVDIARDLRPVCASRALLDADDSPRPAAFALRDAWQPEHAFSRAPAGGPVDGIIGIPVFYVCDAPRSAATVNARAYSMDGRELVCASFPVLGRATDVVGRLCVEMPEDGFLLVRTAIERLGERVCASDALIAPDDGALGALPRTQLLLKDGYIENAGKHVAVGVCAPEANFFGALLPGERVRAENGALHRAEGLNIIF